jgi:hypothetical protein
MWRLGGWGAGAVAAVVAAFMASQSATALRREEIAAVEFSRQAVQLQQTARDSQADARRLATAIDVLNGDRDRLFTRVTVLEQGLDSVTGALGKQTAASQPARAADSAAPTIALPAPTNPTPPPVANDSPAQPPPVIAAVATTVPTEAAPPAPANPSAPAETAAISANQAVAAPVARTDFGLDLGGASSVEGLRALWRGAQKSNAKLFASLHPLIVVRERSGAGLQLRLVAGPFADAATAAKACAALSEGGWACEPAAYDGQRLTMKSDDKPSELKPSSPSRQHPTRRRGNPQASQAPAPAVAPQPAGPQSAVAAIFGSR